MLLFPAKRARLLRRFAGTPIVGLFRASHPNAAVGLGISMFIEISPSDNGQLERASKSVTYTFSETEQRAAKPNFHRGRFAPALESRGKPGSPPKKVSVG